MKISFKKSAFTFICVCAISLFLVSPVQAFYYGTQCAHGSLCFDTISSLEEDVSSYARNNHAPVAKVKVGKKEDGEIILDGSGSYDRDGNQISYHWEVISGPRGLIQDGESLLSEETGVRTKFLVVGEPGDYEIKLTVNDGTFDSKPEVVSINTQNSIPVADAGGHAFHKMHKLFWIRYNLDKLRRSIVYKRPFIKDGKYVPRDWSNYAKDRMKLAREYQTTRVFSPENNSYDPDNDKLTYTWTIKKVWLGKVQFIENVDEEGCPELFEYWGVPVGKNISRSRTSNKKKPHLYLTGAYASQRRALFKLGLTVSDGKNSSEDEIIVYATYASKYRGVNGLFPTARADVFNVDQGEADQESVVFVDSKVVLDGSKSTDPDTRKLSYNWKIIHKPKDSTSTLSDQNTAKPSFTPDVEGIYVAQLSVSDPKDRMFGGLKDALNGDTIDAPIDTVVITAVEGGKENLQ